MKRLLVIAIFALVFITASAHAADKGLYVSGNVGLSLVPDLDQEISGFPVSDVSLDLGIRGSGALGYDFGALRAEGEFAYHYNDTDDGNLFGGGPGPVEGDISALSFMVNGYYDFHMPNSPLVPYLGVGVGFANVIADITAPLISPLRLIDDDDIVLAYQFMAGLGYNIGQNTTLTVDYRYFGTTNPEFSCGPALICAPGIEIESDYSNHSFNFGARFMF